MARLRAVPEVLAREGSLVAERDPRRPTGRLLRQDDMEASYVDLADATHLEFDYMRWIRDALTLARARRVIHLGGAAAALPRALATRDRDSRHVVIEVDPAVLAFARAHLGLRRQPGLRVREGDGRAHVAAQPDASADAIVVDAFVGARVPRHLVTATALADCARVAPLTLVNVVDSGGTDVRAVAAGLAAAYARVAVLGTRAMRAGNSVVLGSAAPVDASRLAARLAADPSPATLVDDRELRRLVAGTAPLRDD